MRKLFLSVSACLLLSACVQWDTAVSGANTYAAAEIKAQQKNAQGVNDNTAAAWADSGCAIPYGELVRNGSGNPNMPAAIITLCGSPSGYTMVHQAGVATATTTIPTTVVTVPVVPTSAAAQ